jgi:hypothetical protein
MKLDEANLSGRRVHGVWRLEPTRSGIGVAEMQSVVPVAHDISDETSKHHSYHTTWFPLQELARRQRVLDDLRQRPDAPLPIASFLANSGFRDLDP